MEAIISMTLLDRKTVTGRIRIEQTAGFKGSRYWPNWI